MFFKYNPKKEPLVLSCVPSRLWRFLDTIVHHDTYKFILADYIPSYAENIDAIRFYFHNTCYEIYRSYDTDEEDWFISMVNATDPDNKIDSTLDDILHIFNFFNGLYYLDLDFSLPEI